MMLRKPLVIAAAALACNLAHADAKNFEGLSINLGAYAVSSTTKISYGSNHLDGLGSNEFVADLGVDYGIALSPNTVLLLGGSYGLSDPLVSDINAPDVDLSGKIKASNRFSLFAAPGVTLSDKVLAYGKVAYVSGKPSGTGYFASANKTHSGFGYGAGVRFLLNENVYLNFEAMNNEYGSEDYPSGHWSAKGLVAGLALGYKF